LSLYNCKSNRDVERGWGVEMISIIIPLYNEEDNIPRYETELFDVVREIAKEFSEDVEFILVDDGSKDKTVKELSAFCYTPNVIMRFHEVNKGMGMAVRTGIDAAVGNIIITMDADLTFRPQDVRLLLESYYKTGADCVSGSPYIKPAFVEGITPFRWLMSKGANIACKIVLLNNDISCVSPIFRLYKSKVIKDMDLISENFEINAEIMAKLLISGKKVVEVPTVLLKRTHGVSKINVKKEIKNYLVLFYRIFKMKYLGMGWN
jgi:dolichol-phosphate mannosyltransferase